MIAVDALLGIQKKNAEDGAQAGKFCHRFQRVINDGDAWGAVKILVLLGLIVRPNSSHVCAKLLAGRSRAALYVTSEHCRQQTASPWSERPLPRSLLEGERVWGNFIASDVENIPSSDWLNERIWKQEVAETGWGKCAFLPITTYDWKRLRGRAIKLNASFHILIQALHNSQVLAGTPTCIALGRSWISHSRLIMSYIRPIISN